MGSIRDDYRSYMLRMWRTKTADHLYLRATLQDVMTSQIHSFASLEELIHFLRTNLDPSNEAQSSKEIEPE